MTENLLNESRSARPAAKTLIKAVSVRVASGQISRSDFDLITGMIKNAIDAFDISIETTSGRRFNCSVVIHLEETN